MTLRLRRQRRRRGREWRTPFSPSPRFRANTRCGGGSPRSGCLWMIGARRWRRDAADPQPPCRRCKWCSGSISAGTPTARYCSARCRQKAALARARAQHKAGVPPMGSTWPAEIVELTGRLRDLAGGAALRQGRPAHRAGQGHPPGGRPAGTGEGRRDSDRGDRSVTKRDPGSDATWFAIAAAVVLPLILAGTAADHAAICR